MDPLCPGCGGRLELAEDICPRCALAQAIPPAVPTIPTGIDRSQPPERRMPVAPDRVVRRSLRLLLAIGIGLTLLVFAVTAVLVWVLFGA